MSEGSISVGAVLSEAGRPLPTTTMQLAGHATGAVVEGLTGSNKAPWMLGVLILNCIGIAAAVYFLNVLITGQQAHLKELLEVQRSQQEAVLTMHKWEFDALMEMSRANAALLSQLPPAPAAAVAPPPPPPPPFPVRRSN